LPWERICYDKQTKKITAKFDISYLDEQWKQISFPSAKEFDITYTRKYIWYNYYLIFPILIIIILFTILWLLIIFNRKKCINSKCKKKIKRSSRVCKFCWYKQKKIK